MEKKNETPIKTQVYNLVILDKSGSMELIRKEAIVGNKEEYYDEDKKQKRLVIGTYSLYLYRKL